MFGSWNKIFNLINYKPILSVLNTEYRQYSVFPPKQDVFKAFRECPYSELKVVILGQDPYPQEGYATGIAFANPVGVKQLSPSLSLIRDKVCKEFNKLSHEFDQTLISWEKQGVLLLNSALTVRANCPSSHSKYWRSFIKNLIYRLNDFNPGLIYVLLGKSAEEFKPFIGPNNHVLVYPHPAYFCRMGGPFNVTMFEDINKLLFSLNKIKIDF